MTGVQTCALPIFSSAHKPTAATQVADLSMEIVMCIFAGLLSAFGARTIWRALKED